MRRELQRPGDLGNSRAKTFPPVHTARMTSSVAQTSSLERALRADADAGAPPGLPRPPQRRPPHLRRAPPQQERLRHADVEHHAPPAAGAAAAPRRSRGRGMGIELSTSRELERAQLPSPAQARTAGLRGRGSVCSGSVVLAKMG